MKCKKLLQVLIAVTTLLFLSGIVSATMYIYEDGCYVAYDDTPSEEERIIYDIRTYPTLCVGEKGLFAFYFPPGQESEYMVLDGQPLGEGPDPGSP